MRLISWNVNGRCGPALPRQLAAVRERGADVVVAYLTKHLSETGPADAWIVAVANAGSRVARTRMQSCER